MKNIMEENTRNIIEKGEKINVNRNSFNLKMKECLEKRKFSIFGKAK